MLEQNEFKQCLLRFDDNKVLKVQLDMLISVQVCRTIDKNLNVWKQGIGSGRTN